MIIYNHYSNSRQDKMLHQEYRLYHVFIFNYKCTDSNYISEPPDHPPLLVVAELVVLLMGVMQMKMPPSFPKNKKLPTCQIESLDRNFYIMLTIL